MYHSENYNLADSGTVNIIYVKYKDLAGNETACLSSNSILHDGVAPTAPTGLSLGVVVPSSDTSTVGGDGQC